MTEFDTDEILFDEEELDAHLGMTTCSRARPWRVRPGGRYVGPQDHREPLCRSDCLPTNRSPCVPVDHEGKVVSPFLLRPLTFLSVDGVSVRRTRWRLSRPMTA